MFVVHLGCSCFTFGMHEADPSQFASSLSRKAYVRIHMKS
jgi:hypothetical protein